VEGYCQTRRRYNGLLPMISLADVVHVRACRGVESRLRCLMPDLNPFHLSLFFAFVYTAHRTRRPPSPRYPRRGRSSAEQGPSGSVLICYLLAALPSHETGTSQASYTSSIGDHRGCPLVPVISYGRILAGVRSCTGASSNLRRVRSAACASHSVATVGFALPTCLP